MKKVFSFLIAVAITVMSVSAYGASLDFLTQITDNVTENASFSVKLENAAEVAALLDETLVLDSSGSFVNVKTLLEGLLGASGSCTVRVAAEDGFSKAKAEISAMMDNAVDVNKNLSLKSHARFEMWVDYDLRSDSPYFKTVISSPFSEKYIVSELTDGQTELAALAGMLEILLDDTFLNAANTTYVEIVAKYAKVEQRGGKCVVKIDNDALISIVREVLSYTSALYTPFVKEENVRAEITEALGAIASFKNCRILGKDGITLTYKLANGKISAYDVSADVDLDIAAIYESITGEKWDFVECNSLCLDIEVKSELTKYGKTTVDLPQLTEENLIYIDNYLPEAENDFEVAELPEDDIPLIAYAEVPKLYRIDSVVYLPLRASVDTIFDGNYDLSYDNGVVALKIGSRAPIYIFEKGDKAYTDTEEFYIGNVFNEDGVMFVPTAFFEKCFGYVTEDVSHNLLNDTYSFYMCIE